ncbi:hypothetical protein CRYUN_Cryun15aG0094100 [Craigia yunnanensis]
MYENCGSIGDACLVFDEIIIKDVVAWMALMIGYVQNGKSEKSLECLCDMHKISEDGENRPNFRILEGGLHACENLCAWNEGYGMHGDAKSTLQFFQRMEESNVKVNDLTFLSLLNSCAYVGLAEEGKFLFSRMEHYSTKPNLKH